MKVKYLDFRLLEGLIFIILPAFLLVYKYIHYKIMKALLPISCRLSSVSRLTDNIRSDYVPVL